VRRFLMGVAAGVLVGAVMTPVPAEAAGTATFKVPCGNIKLLKKGFTKARGYTRTKIVLDSDGKPNCVYKIPYDSIGGKYLLSKYTIVVEGNQAVLEQAGPNRFTDLIKVTSGSLTLRDVTVKTHDTGAATVSKSAKLTLAGTTMLTSLGSDTGSGIYVAGELEMQDQSQVTGFSSVRGGGIDNGGTLTMSGNSRVSGNSADNTPQGGGGVWNEGTMVMKDAAAIADNNTTGMADHFVGGLGGGIYNKGGKVTVQDRATISGNTAAPNAGGKPATPSDQVGKGGGIYNTGTASVAPGSITQNKPTQCAGPEPVTGCTN
jgi:Chlamydia polymorphic membrane protein (Chlamydia_PMP) repeat